MNTKLGIFCALAMAHVMSANDIILLDAIAEVETGHNPESVGLKGEVSMYQITPDNWKLYTTRPLAEAQIPGVALAVALKHLEWTRKELKKLRPTLTKEQLTNPYMMAIAWRWGPKGMMGSAVMSEKIDYGTRVMNIYHQMLHR